MFGVCVRPCVCVRVMALRGFLVFCAAPAPNPPWCVPLLRSCVVVMRCVASWFHVRMLLGVEGLYSSSSSSSSAASMMIIP